MAQDPGHSLHRLVYRSRSLLGNEDSRGLTSIFRASETNNSRAGITGCLALVDATFVQVIEGSSGTIFELMARIECDERHDSIKVLSDRVITARLFRGWAMARITIPPLSPETVNVLTETGGAAHVTGILLGLMDGPTAGFGTERV